MTSGQPLNDDCYIPPVPAGTPPPKDPNNTLWIVIAVLFFGAVFILPFVIAAFVFSMAGTIEHTKVVAATAQQNSAGTIIVTYQGGQDAGSLAVITVTITDSTGQVQTKPLIPDSGTGVVNVGSALEFEGAFTRKDHVVATGYFDDGTEQVILDTFV